MSVNRTVGQDPVRLLVALEPADERLHGAHRGFVRLVVDPRVLPAHRRELLQLGAGDVPAKNSAGPR